MNSSGGGGGGWLLQNLKVSVPLAAMIFVFLQWAVVHFHSDLQEPERKKAAAEIRGIRRDARTMLTYQLEYVRFSSSILQQMASSNGVKFEVPHELEEAEAKARKLRDK